MSDLPKGWSEASLGDCVEVLDRKRIPLNREERDARIDGKDQADLVPYFGATGKVGYIDDFIFDEEILLLGEDGAPFHDRTKEKAYIVRGKSWVNNHAHVLVAHEGVSTNLFLKHYLDHFDYHGYVTGTTRLKLNQGALRTIPVPLPPLPEQRRIVARIEELFSRLDAGVAALRHAKAQLQRYRQSVLAAAVTGQLTQAWREQHPETEPAEELLERILEQRREQWDGRGKYKEPYAPTTDHDLPGNWVSATSDQLIHFVTSGSRGWAEYYSEEGAIFLRIGNLEHEDIALDLDDIQRVMPPEGAEGSRTRVQTNDILISITADVGMVALVDTDIGEAYINQHVALARPSDEVNPRFLAWLLASKPTKAQWKLLQRGATKVGLGLDDIRAVQLGLPPLAEQHQIVAEVEARTTAIDHLEAELARQITRSNRLRQSTLSSAFSGNL